MYIVVLCLSVLCRVVHCCSVLCCVVLYSAVLFSAVKRPGIVEYCAILYNVVRCHSVMFCLKYLPPSRGCVTMVSPMHQHHPGKPVTAPSSPLRGILKAKMKTNNYNLGYSVKRWGTRTNNIKPIKRIQIFIFMNKTCLLIQTKIKCRLVICDVVQFLLCCTVLCCVIQC